VDRLLNIPAVTHDGHLVPQQLVFDDSARAYIQGVARGLEPKLGEGGALYEIADWSGKSVGTLARIAALLHLAEHPSDRVIGLKAVSCAHEISLYLEEHALHAFATMARTLETTRALKVVAWLKRHAIYEFTQREVFEGVKRTIPTVEDLKEVLALPAEHNLIRPLPRDTPTRAGRPRGPVYQVNAAVHASTGQRHGGVK
jgi:hypothetical protein